MKPIDFNGLDTAIHGPVRLGVMSALQTDGALDFTTLRKRLDVADGALGVHLRKLEDAGYITCRKSFVGRRPKSTYRVSAAGRKALAEYLREMRRVLQMLEGAPGAEAPGAEADEG